MAPPPHGTPASHQVQYLSPNQIFNLPTYSLHVASQNFERLEASSLARWKRGKLASLLKGCDLPRPSPKSLLPTAETLVPVSLPLSGFQGLQSAPLRVRGWSQGLHHVWGRGQLQSTTWTSIEEALSPFLPLSPNTSSSG